MCEGSGSGGLTVGWRVCTFPFLDGDVVNGDVSLDAGATDSLYQHLTGNHLSVVKLSSDNQLRCCRMSPSHSVVSLYLKGCGWLDVDLGLKPLVSLVTTQTPYRCVRHRWTFLPQKYI